MAYTGVGLLARRSPALFSKDPNHLLRLFKVLSDSTVDRDIVLAVQECMSLVAPVYRGVGDQTALLLEAAILENIYNVSYIPIKGCGYILTSFSQHTKQD